MEGDVLASDPAGLGWVLLQQHGLLDRQQRPAAQDRPRPGGRLWRAVVGKGAGRSFRGSSSMRGPSAAAPVAVAPAGAVPTRERRPSRPGSRASGRGAAGSGGLGRPRWGVTHADAEHEAARIGFGQGPLGRGHCHRVTSPDVGDPGADDQLLAGAQQQPGVGQRLSAEDLPCPQRAPAQLLPKWPGRSAIRLGRAGNT